jgi:hypothetical protein
MFKNIKKKFTTKAVLYFILVVALLIITVDQKNKISNLQAEVSGLIDIGETIENQNTANLVALEAVITSYEQEVIALKDSVVKADGERVKAEIERERIITQLESVGQELTTVTSALDEALENPNCPVATQ